VRRTLAVGLSAILLAWGAVYFHAQVTQVSPETGVEWIDSSRGVVADAVIPRTPAWRGGLRPGDLLAGVDGRPIRTAVAAEDAAWSAGRGGVLVYEIIRDGEAIGFSVRPIWVGGGEAVYYYLSIVGLTFLAVGVVVWLRATRARAAVPFALLCQAMFLLLVLRRSGQGGILDWTAYWGDLAGFLLAPPLFLHINQGLADEDRGGAGRRLRRASLYLPAFLLFAWNLYLIPFKGVYGFADPEAAIRFKNRLEEVYMAVFVIAGIVKAVRAYLSAERLQTRWQLKWMAWGSLVGFLPAALFYLIPRSLNIRIGGWSELSLLPMAVIPLAFAAAIVRYRLVDLDIFLKRGIVGTGLLLSAGATYAACYIVMDRATGGVRGARGVNWALVLATLLMAIAYPRLHRRLRSVVDQFFYRERYDYRRTLMEFGEALNRELSLEAVRRKFLGRVTRTFGLQQARVFARGADGHLLEDEPPGGAIPIDDPLVEALRKVDYLSLRDHPGILAGPTGSWLAERLGMEFLLPLTVEGEIVAILGIGAPHGGEPMTSEDLDLLVSLCRHGAVAFEGARLYSAVQEKVREVEALKEFNESILESSRVGILVADPDGRVVGVNRAFENLYGAGRPEIRGSTLAEVLPAGLFALGGDAETPAGGPMPDEGIRVYRSSLRTRDGRRLLVNLTQSPLRGPDGEPRGRVITVDDVTEQVLREQELQRREHLASIGLLASGIAHEVNTPLTGISSYAQLLLQELSPEAPQYGVLKKIEQQAFRAAGIASSLLNFSRQRDGDYQSLEVGDMVRETLELFEPHIRGRRIELVRAVEEGLPPVHGNRGRLQQVLMNLLLNAADAMPDGGVLTLAARAAAGRVRIEVADTGVGISPEHLDRIYDPFFTTKPRGKGTGLGLSVSYGIVKEHAGTLAAESAPGEGSRFVVSLPVLDGERRVSA
jgi:hypothetical protein